MFDELINDLKIKLFGGKTKKTRKIASHEEIVSSPLGRSNVSDKRIEPYFVQIGFDFGTAYSKCICRDVMTNKAWVHIPSEPKDSELPFLIPGVLLFEKGSIKPIYTSAGHYHENGLYHLKLALEKVALKQWNDPVLRPYCREPWGADPERIARFVEVCGIYFLAGALGDIRRKLRDRFTDFGNHLEDYMAVNLAVPVADAERPAIKKLYSRVLCHAWSLSDCLAGHPEIRLDELDSLVYYTKDNLKEEDFEACFVYPEVSANVQGYVRSRASSPGIYIFSDTGAGTVDQAVFIYNRQNHQEHLSYLFGHVIPLGSSRIEEYAAEIAGKVGSSELERWREGKERGADDRELVDARNKLAEELSRKTRKTLFLSRQKLFVKEQIRDMRVIFGGGGHCKMPYEIGVLQPFGGDLFSQPINPDVIGLPTPVDLSLEPHQKRWLPRLSVAYGLSFEKSELTRFTYPVEIEKPEPDEIWVPQKVSVVAASKDVC